MEDSNAVELICTLILMCVSILTIFFFCEFGDMINTQFDEFDDQLRQCDWYTFPIEMQQLLVIFMTSTQRPAMIQGFANTECTRDAFKKV